eukprot:TRINITY_DN7389_c0_g1_i1.p1 TRINITY_DN7389_c0_g1~~TRINITY_DN7389_c0_g1_i1.p1  ORF type:complete len:1229 (-),score=219.53 TRINITY_DN7389_c0_g1_i1:148-3834(-)
MEVSPSSEGRYDADYGEPSKRRKTFHGYPCPKCGTGVGFNAKVCKKCGSTVGKTAREASQASPRPTPTKLRSPKSEPTNAASNSTRAAPRVLIVSPKTPKASLAPISSPPDSPAAQPVVPIVPIPAQLVVASRSPRLKVKSSGLSPCRADILDSMSPLEAFGISELRAHVTALRQENVAKPLRNLLHRLWNHPANKGLFNTEVNVQMLPGYTKAVDKVMDLSVIKTRLQKLSYDDPEDFAADVHLVFQNARSYYAPTHHIHIAAEQMMNDFEDELDKATKRIDRDDTKRSEHFCTLCHGHECTLCGAKCIKHEPPILYCHGTCDQRVRVGARYYITLDGSRLWCQRCYAGLPSSIPNSGENPKNLRRAAGSLPPQLMGAVTEEEPPEPDNDAEVKEEPEEGAAAEGESSTKKKRVLKRDLLKRRFDEEVAEPWVQCDACQHWVHQLCVMYNTASNYESCDSVPFYCPLCKLRGSQRGGKGNSGGVSIPPVPATGGSTKMWCAAALPENHMSRFIQDRVHKRLKDSGEPKAAPSVVVRIVSTNDKTTDPSEMLRKYFAPPTAEQLFKQGKMDENGNVKDVPLSKRYEMPNGQPLPGEMPYRSKTLLLFQRLDGIDVCLFAMYVSEYDKDCPGPNKRHVYVAYLDSVEYFRPRTHRTIVYHEVLVAYLEYAKRRGFVAAHIWACPPLRGNHFIFWSHPSHQRTPSRERLVSWYLAMLTRAQELGTVDSVTNLYSAYFKCASTLKEGGAGKKVAKGKAGATKAAGAAPGIAAGALPAPTGASLLPDSCSQSVANGPEGVDDAASAANSGGTAADSVAESAAPQLCAFDESQRAQLGGNAKHAIVNCTGQNNCLNRPFKCPPIFEGDYWPEEASRLERETRKRKGLGVADREHLPVKEQCEGLVAQLMNHPSAYPFNAPVDAKALNIPDYYKVVTRPMDLGRVKSGIQNLTYSTVQQFADDVRQVWANANAYNPPRHPITAMATTLSSLFEKELRGMFNCWVQAGISKRGLNTRLDGQSVMDGMLDSDDDVDGADPEDDVVLVTEVANSPRDKELKEGVYGGLGNDVALWGNNSALPPTGIAARRGTGRGNSSTKKKGRKKKKAAEPKDKEPEIKQKYHSIVTYTANSVQCMRDELLVARLHPCCTTCGEYFVEGYRWHDPESGSDYCAECKQHVEEHLVPHKVTVEDTSDPDEKMSSGFVDSRHSFLEVCQFRHYQFDTLRNAKHLSLIHI